MQIQRERINNSHIMTKRISQIEKNNNDLINLLSSEIHALKIERSSLKKIGKKYFF